MIYRYDFLAKQWFESNPNEMREYMQRVIPEPPITDDQLSKMVNAMKESGVDFFNVSDPVGKRAHLVTDQHFQFRWSDNPPSQGEKDLK